MKTRTQNEYNYINSYFRHIDRLGDALEDILVAHSKGQDIKYKIKSYFLLSKFLEAIVSPHRHGDYMQLRDKAVKKYKDLDDIKENRELQIEHIIDYVMITMDLAFDAGLFEYSRKVYDPEEAEGTASDKNA